MDRTAFFLPIILILLSTCSQPLSQDPGEIRDTNLIGTWYHDLTANGDSPDDKRVIFGADGSFSHASYVDPDGAGGEPFQWIIVDTPFKWSNGFYSDYSDNAPPNNLISGDIVLDDGTGAQLYLFRYEYSNYPSTLEITPGTVGYNGFWTRI